MRVKSLIFLWALAAIFFFETVQSKFQLQNLSSSEKSTAAPGINESSPSYRLPNETYPEHYAIKLTTNVHTGEKLFQGEVIIDIVVVSATTDIVLHARDMEIFTVNIEYTSTGESEELFHEYEEEREFLILRRNNNKMFAAGIKLKLSITYSGQLYDGEGFYMSKYVDDEGKDHYLALTRFESINARHAFPCYDEPAKRARFSITIIHSPNYRAISNMPVSKDLSSSTKTVFLTTPSSPTYILAFVVSDFEYTEGIWNGLRQRVYSCPNRKHEHNFALQSAMLFTNYLSEYFGVEFMLPKLDHVALPYYPVGASENWGLAIYGEVNLLYNNDTSTVGEHNYIGVVLSHEIAHQWLGNYVTIQSWTYLWIKEGLSNLFAYKALENIYSEWSAWHDFHVEDYQKVLDFDSSNTSRALSFYVEEPTEIAKLYDIISYAKACSVLLMWNNALTEKVFQKAIQNLLKHNRYNAIAEEQLFNEIANATQEENYELPAAISEMISSWTYQTGYPLLTVTRNYADGTFIIRQETFYQDEKIKDDKTWYVPINFAMASNPDFRDTKATHYLLNANEVQVADRVRKNDWLVANKQSTGFYRIKYDAENYNLITECLIKRPFKIHWRNRAQLMDDAYHLSISKRLNHSILLKMMTYLKQEDQYAPWKTASMIISKYNRYLKNEDDYKSFVAELVRPIYKRLGVDEIPGEHRNHKYIRDVIIDMACAAGIKECLRETNNKLKNLIKRNIPIEPNLEKSIYCNGLIQSGDEEFNFVYQKLMDTTDTTTRDLYIKCLGCSRNKNHIKKFFSSSEDNLLDYEHSIMLESVSIRTEEGLFDCIEFLNENLNTYLSEDLSVILEDNILNMAKYVVNIKAEKKLLDLVDKVKTNTHMSDSLEIDVKETIAKNFQWLHDHRQPLMLWISKYRDISVKSPQKQVPITLSMESVFQFKFS